MRQLIALIVLTFFISYLPVAVNAAGGPVAKDFGADDWLNKIHVVFSVFGIVAVATIVLIILILRKK